MSDIFDYNTCEPFRAWNRIEPRPRQKEFDQSLKADIHDALWMLTRQWQFGELQGEDTGSAVFAKVQIETTAISRFKDQFGNITPYDNSIPLEAKVERMPVQYDLRLRARAGQYWLKRLKLAGDSYNTTNGWVAGDANYYDHAVYRKIFADLYAFELPVIDRNVDATALQVAKSRLLSNQAACQSITALAGRSPDGVQWLAALKAIGNPPASLPIALTATVGYNAAHTSFILATAVEYMAWFAASHEQPAATAEGSWVPSNLEYKFAVTLPNIENIDNTVLEADEYYQGRLDWYAFDHALNDDLSGMLQEEVGETAAYTKTEVLTLIPAEARFGGMPNSRWWEFEDGFMDLGNITAETTSPTKVILSEFALMYSNDWFVIPYAVPAGSLSEVKGIVVTDTFGIRTLIEPAGQGDSNDWTSWTMFNLSRNAASEGLSGKVDPRIFIPPALSKLDESKPLECVEMIRDEMANMVWGVETIVPDLLGGGQEGLAAAQILTNYFAALERSEPVAPTVIPEEVKLRYSLGNTVPENWIPFLPTHLPGQNRAIQLQRASMPRWFNGDFTQVRPQTSILRDGMTDDLNQEIMPFVNPSQEEQTDPYYIHEEEVPRSGVRIESSWQRTRWYDGKIVTWYGRRKQTSRGEGGSGLVFDQVLDVEYEGREALVPAGG
jgi:hypothetical protein